MGWGRRGGKEGGGESKAKQAFENEKTHYKAQINWGLGISKPPNSAAHGQLCWYGRRRNVVCARNIS